MEKKDIHSFYKKISQFIKNASSLINSDKDLLGNKVSSADIMQPSIGMKIVEIFVETSLTFWMRVYQVLFSENEKYASIRMDLKRMEKIDRYIFLHFNEDIQEGEIAQHVGMSTGNFCRFFRRTKQCNFIDYLNNYRIKQASLMLLDANGPVTDVAYSCGFNTNHHFIRTFKKIKGKTPNQFRKNENQNELETENPEVFINDNCDVRNTAE